MSNAKEMTAVVVAYESPTITDFGTLRDLTQGCDKRFGSSDGFTFQGQAVVCRSA
jgi:hypothetical protein